MTREQRQVARRMAAASVTTLVAATACVSTSWRPWGFGTGAADRLLYGFACALPASACLAVAIGAVTAGRFFTPEDIGGAGLTVETPALRVRAALLQNTLEQVALAVPVYLAAAMLLPDCWLGVVAAASVLFVTGRAGFAHGYRAGAAKRAFGFGISFYPSLLLLAASLVAAASR